MPDRRLLELPLAPVGRFARDGRFQVRIEHLIGVELGAVAGQVEHLDRIAVLRQPGLDRLGVMHPQVVQDQKHLLALAFDQTTQEVDQERGVECAFKDAPGANASQLSPERLENQPPGTQKEREMRSFFMVCRGANP